jgi:1-acyl-sn-glycerol-3-phosphate acyltransferase
MNEPAVYRPPRPLARFVLHRLSYLAIAILTDFRVVGAENIPIDGPLLVVGNHFHFADPVAVIRAIPGPMEFVGGFQMPNAPAAVTWLPRLWGYHAVRRKGVSRDAMRGAAQVLTQGGRLSIFPEGGSWAAVLRPPRPGAAYLAVESGVRLLPLGIDGMTDVFSLFRRGQRATITARIGQPFGPFSAEGTGRARRAQLQAIGDEIMQRIAALIPSARHGVYSDDPQIRAAAQDAAKYPWD